MPEAGRSGVERLSRVFERLGGWSFDHRGLVLLACLVLLAGSLWLAGRARFDNSFEAYFDRDDPTYATYNTYREDFGSDEVSYIVYEAPGREHGAFDLEVMRALQGLGRALEGVPFVAEVTSLANAEYLEGVEDGLEIHELLAELPGSQAELLALREKVLAEPLYVDSLISRDGMVGALVLEMERSSVDAVELLRHDPGGGDELGNLYPQVTYHAIQEILARPEFALFRFHHVGDVPLNAVYNEVVSQESGWLGALTLGSIALLLSLFFRSPIGVVGPLAVVALSVVVALGFVGLLQWKLDLMFIMLPTLLIAVGVADAVHIIAEFRSYHAELGDRREAARRTMALVGTPCLLTSLTTAAGLAAMSIAPIPSIAHFGIYSAVGVIAAFLLSVTLLMLFLSLGRRRLPRGHTEQERRRAKGGQLFHRGLAAVAEFDLRHRRAILAAFALLFAGSVAGIARLQVNSNFLHEFSPEEPVRQASEFVDETLGGSFSFVYLLDSGVPDGVKDLRLLRTLDGLQEAARRQSDVVRASTSLGDLLKDINQAFHEEDAAYHALPESRDLVAQYLLVYEMSGGEELGEYVSSDFARASLQLRTRAAATQALEQMAGELDGWLAANADGSAEITATGIGALWLRLQDYITQSQIRGFLLAFSVIAALLCLVFGSLRTGLLAMVPNLSPVVLTLGAMGWLEIPLDYVRLLIGSLAIGISVDDTIHHVTRFRLEFARLGSYEAALRASMADVGRALVITSVVLVVGFLMMLQSRLDTMVVFGSLIAGTIAMALLADFLLMPALVLSVRPWGPERALSAPPARSAAPR